MKNKITNFIIAGTISITQLYPCISSAQVNLYGLTSQGGTYNGGTVFSFTPSGNMEIIADLNWTLAAIPGGTLLYASDGNFYASSVDGGYNDSCTIFRCSPTGVITIMINLDSVWGSSDPLGNSLIQAMDNNLYGMTTIGGGTSSYGVLFELKLSGQYSALHFFNDTDGAEPYGSLIQTSDSTFWGMTSAGGLKGLGTIFNYAASGIFNSVYNFDTLDGGNPFGDLLLANDGNFYGLTSSGGFYNHGTLFRYSPSGTFTKLVDFNDTNGAAPNGSLMQASDGNLYGLTRRGGSFNGGTLFVCTLTGNLTELVQFGDSGKGSNPMGTLMQASDGNLYGMTYSGGQFNKGTIFQYSLSNTFTKLFDFDSSAGNGYYPLYSKFIEVDDISTGLNKPSNITNAQLFPNPNNGQFTLQIKNQGVGICDVKVYNSLGEKVYSQFHIKPQTFSIDLSSRPDGIYFYRVLEESGNTISTGKFIIQK